MINWQHELKELLIAQPFLNATMQPVSPEGIVLYGAGAMGHMAMDIMSRVSIRPNYIVDKYVQGEINGVRIISPELIPGDDLKKLTFIVCVVSSAIDPIFSFLHGIGCIDVRHFYDYSELALKEHLSNGWYHPATDEDTIRQIESVLKALEHDEYSAAHYLQFLWWRLRRKEVVYEEFPVLSGKKYFYAPHFPILGKTERFVDGGAHFGNVIMMLAEITCGNFDVVWAFEPDDRNLNVLLTDVPPEVISRVRIFREALSDKDELLNFMDGLGYASKVMNGAKKTVRAVRLDSVADINPTIIKLHLEGYELKALLGAAETIARNRPIIMVMADHTPDGLFKIAHFLMGVDRYKLYFNLHDYCGNSAIYYCIPTERIK